MNEWGCVKLILKEKINEHPVCRQYSQPKLHEIMAIIACTRKGPLIKKFVKKIVSHGFLPCICMQKRKQKKTWIRLIFFPALQASLHSAPAELRPTPIGRPEAEHRVCGTCAGDGVHGWNSVGYLLHCALICFQPRFFGIFFFCRSFLPTLQNSYK